MQRHTEWLSVRSCNFQVPASTSTTPSGQSSAGRATRAPRKGILAHSAGSTDDGFCVIEWWSSEGEWDAFFADRLMPAFEKVGGIPQPQTTRFEVHASYVAS